MDEPAPNDANNEPLSAPDSIEALEEMLSAPTPELIESLSELEGDIALLGVGGKMGPTMARMAVRALREAGRPNRVIGVSRYSDEAVRQRLEDWGVQTVSCDLLDADSVAQLPDAAHVISMSGFKFGAKEHPELAWATNCYLPALVCRRYQDSRIIAFSTGNVYGLTTPGSGGSRESDPPAPIGEYAHTALGRERMFEFFARRQQTPVLMLRLNYATELRYGVLVDLAQQIKQGQPVSVEMGHVNVIWLHDANLMTLRALGLPPRQDTPYDVLNLAGQEILSVRKVCQQLAQRMGCEADLVGEEAPHALLNNGRAAYPLLGEPQVDAETMIDWTADWVAGGGELLGKPTHFEVRDGKF
ncbi:MAG: NAD(P)-dependent oxidoreductase [Planctomycetales bacterium]|nr:NAD(P)-dependent oxidoreductase [Planctomycetales bacterium]